LAPPIRIPLYLFSKILATRVNIFAEEVGFEPT
jgi:hypothetical protein